MHCRALCEEDVQGSSSGVRNAAGEEGHAIMPQGALKESGLSSTDAYLTRKAGMFCDVVERLAHSHLQASPSLCFRLVTCCGWCHAPFWLLRI